MVDLEDAQFDQFVQDNEIVVIDFWAPWCGPCKRLSPVVEEIAGEMAGKITFAKMNTDEQPRTAQQFGVMSIPTLLVLKGGKPVDQMVGALPKQAIVDKLSKFV